MNEAHFCSLPTQSNVYGLNNIALPDSMSKLLVACLRGKVVSIEHDISDDSFSSKEAHFTYIPGDAEIVSIDAFNKKSDKSGVVIGITFVKNNETKPSKFLNIYSEWEPETEFNLDSIAQGCFNLELQFIPFQLYHAELICDDSKTKEIVFLLSGNDKKVHLFREDIFLHIFGEHPVDRFFPEFINLPSNVIWIDIRYMDEGKQRLTAIGCQDGYVRLVCVNAISKDIINQWSIQHDSPITSIKLFEFHTKVNTPESIHHICSNDGENAVDEAPESEKESIVEQEKQKETSNPDYHLLVCGALEVTVVYRSVLENGLQLSNQIVLPESNDYDCVLCACVADLNFDGHNEIILGTYGQELLIYRHFLPEEMKQRQQQQLHQSLTNNTEDTDKELDTSLHADLSSSLPYKLDGEYALIGRRSFAYPLLAIDKLDLTCDGMEELAVLSQCGLHILQHNPDDVAKICLERLKKLVPENSNHRDNKENPAEDDGETIKVEVMNDLESLHIKDDTETKETSGS